MVCFFKSQAGKTTTINMLIGSVEPTSGDAWVGGLHIVKDREELRSSLGLCPQFDVLYDEMTPAEQLRLYGGMAGLSEEDAAAETDRLLELLKMTFKANEPVRTLSGGQKRRISLATALIGNPRRILLDEPTTGMDPANRRGVWKVLQEQKQAGVNVVMTTHSMEEADILGDTIGIMADGKLEAFGPSLELKRKYDPLHNTSRSFTHLFLLAAFHSKSIGVLQLSASVPLLEPLSVNLVMIFIRRFR